MFVYFETINTMGAQVRERSLGRLGADGTVSETPITLYVIRVGKGLNGYLGKRDQKKPGEVDQQMPPPSVQSA